jgi:hypothetical protein
MSGPVRPSRPSARFGLFTLVALALAALALTALALDLAGCAPPPKPAPLDAGALRSRYLEALSAREGAARALEAELSLWPVLGERRLPGTLASLKLAAPDRCRLRVASPGGTLLDAVGSGAELDAWLPGTRTLAEMTACAESAGITDLPALVVRTAAALWRPADGNSARTAADPPNTLEWSEGGRSIRVRMSSEGLPDTVTLSRAGGMVQIAYLDWMSARGTRLPREFRVTADSARAMLRCQVSRVRLRAVADSADFRTPGPPDAAREAGCELWRMLVTGDQP